MVYLDHAATTPLRPEAREAMLPFLGERFGNPSGLYAEGREAQRALDAARDTVAERLSARSTEILLRDTGCTVLFSTPTYAMHMAGVAERENIDIASSPIRRLILTGEPGGSLPTVRQRLRDAWNAEIFDHAGATETGAYGIPCPQGRGLFVNEREFIAEVLALDDDHPVEDGHTGELVLTNLGRWGYPVIRYRTGDLVRPERLDEGLLLAGGILGRVDQMMVVRGVNLHPSGIEEAVRRTAGESEFRISVTRQGAMDEAEIEVEAAPPACRLIAEDVRSTYGVRVEVKSVPRNSLPRWQAKAKRFRDLRE